MLQGFFLITFLQFLVLVVLGPSLVGIHLNNYKRIKGADIKFIVSIINKDTNYGGRKNAAQRYPSKSATVSQFVKGLLKEDKCTNDFLLLINQLGTGRLMN